MNNAEFWDFISSNFPHNKNSSYHEFFQSAIHCINDDKIKNFQKSNKIEKVDNGIENKIS